MHGTVGLLLLLLTAGLAQAAERVLHLEGQALSVEVAATRAERERGLMERTELGANAGMLFVFPVAQRQCLWMKNTPLPLSALFLDEHGRVLNHVDLTPHERRLQCSAGPARYAIEANQGWFAARGIGPGSRVEGLPPVD